MAWRLPLFLGVLLFYTATHNTSAQSNLSARQDSLLQIINNHQIRDTTWVLIRYQYILTLLDDGKHREAINLCKKYMPIADSLGYARGKIGLTRWIGIAYLSMANDSSEMFLKQAAEMAMANGQLKTVANCYVSLALEKQKTGDPKTALSYAFDARDLATKLDEQIILSRSNSVLGTIYMNSFSDYPTALRYYFEALDYPDRFTKAVNLSNIGIVFHKMKEYGKAKNYYDAAIKAERENGRRQLLMDIIRNKSDLFLDMKRYDSALVNYTLTLNMAKELNARERIADCKLGMGTVYLNYNKSSLALKNLKEAEKIYLEIGYTNAMVTTYHRMAQASKMAGNPDEEWLYLNKGLTYQPELNKAAYKNILGELVSLSEKKNDFASALKYQKQIAALQDSIFNEDKLREIMRAEAGFQVELSKKEVEALEAKNLLNETELESQKFNRKVMIAVVLLFALLIIFILYAYLIKIKAARKLQDVNQIIESQKEELGSSLENLKITQEQLIHSRKMASLGQITSNIAHEINNPLNFISGSVQALEQTHREITKLLKDPKLIDPEKVEEIDSESASLFQTLRKGVDRVTKIIYGLRVFSSPQTGELSEIPVADIIEMSLALLDRKIIDLRIQVERRFSDQKTVVYVNPAQISQVFLNIMDNAVQAMESNSEQRHLKIETKKLKGNIQVAISDNGPGISEKHKEKIMEPFFTTKPVGKGTGLGLSISYSIIEKHGGSISFESEEGEGTTFLISLPEKN